MTIVEETTNSLEREVSLTSRSTMHGAPPVSEQVLPTPLMSEVQHENLPLPRPLQPTPPHFPHKACRVYVGRCGALQTEVYRGLRCEGYAQTLGP